MDIHRLLSDRNFYFHILLQIKGNSSVVLPDKISEDNVAGLFYALLTLSETERALFQKYYIESDSPMDICSVLSLSENAFLQIQKRATNKLRLPSRWNYIRYGVAGYLKKFGQNEFCRGYELGYHDGTMQAPSFVKDAFRNTASPEILARPLAFLELPIRASNALQQFGCQQIGDVARLTEEQIMRIRNLGRIGCNEVALALMKCGIQGTAWNAFLL